MNYLVDLRGDIESELDGKLGNDAAIDTFWSNDIIEFVDYILDNQPRIGQQPHVYVTVPTLAQSDRHTIPLDVTDNISVWVWIAYKDARSEERRLREAEEIAILSRAYLSRTEFGLTFTNDNAIDNWQLNVEEETDDIIVYSLVGDLELEVDNQKLINEYES